MVDPSLRFLRGYGHVLLLDCCGGILLCSGWDHTMERRVYLLCNPATQEIWAALPVPDTQEPGAPLVYAKYITSLCFNPAVPGRFAVFVVSRGHISVGSVEVYSSDTGEWAPGIKLLAGEPGHIFLLKGTLHFRAYYCGEDTFDSEGNINTKLWIVTVDMDGSTWKTIRMPPKVFFFFHWAVSGTLIWCGG